MRSRPSHIPLNVCQKEAEEAGRPGSSLSPVRTSARAAKKGSRRRGRTRPRKFPDSGESSNHIPVPTAHNDPEQKAIYRNRTGALARLGLSPEQISLLPRLPRITHLLEYANGGVPAVIAALRLAEDPGVTEFLEKYDALSASDLDRVTVEEIAVAAGIMPKRLLELAVSALVEDSQSLGKIIAASYHPRVIRSTAESALLMDNHNDRKLFLSGTGYIPQSGNRTGGVFVQNTINLPPVPSVGNGNEDTDTGPVFNAAEDDLQRLHSQLDGTRQLEAPKTVVDTANIQIGHQYKEDMECIPVPVPVHR